MKNLLQAITNLLKVKTLVTLCVMSVFTALSLKGKIPPDHVMTIVTAVIAFYFGTQHERNQ